MALAPRGGELRREHHLLQWPVERLIWCLKHHESERLGLAETIDYGVYDCVAGHAAGQQLGWIGEFGTRHPRGALIQLAIGIDPERTRFRFEQIVEARRNLIQALHSCLMQ